MRREFTAVVQKRGTWYVGFIEEVPGANAQGRTLAELRRNLRDALREVLEAYREIARQDLGASLRREVIGLSLRQ